MYWYGACTDQFVCMPEPNHVRSMEELAVKFGELESIVICCGGISSREGKAKRRDDSNNNNVVAYPARADNITLSSSRILSYCTL